MNIEDSQRSGGQRHPRLNLYVIQCQKGPAAGALRSQYLLASCAVIKANEELCSAHFPTVTHCSRLLMKYPREFFSVHVDCYQPAANEAQFHMVGRRNWKIALAELAVLALLLLLIQGGFQGRVPADSNDELKACLIRDCRWSSWYEVLAPSGQRLEEAR